MPISIFEGAPGGGKSYNAVKACRDAVNSGREVWTNIEGLNVSLFTDPSLIHIMSEGEVQRPWLYLPKNCLCIIDEALIPFADDFGKNDDTDLNDMRDLKKWATQHRHDGQDIIMVVQDCLLLARVIRNVAAVRINYHNQGHLGFGKRCRIKYFSPCKERRPFKTENIKYDVEVFKLYESVKAGSDLAAAKGKNILFSPFVIFPILALTAAFYAMAGMFNRYDSDASAQVDAVVQAPAVLQKSIVEKKLPLDLSTPAPVQKIVPVEKNKTYAWVSGFSIMRGRVFVFLSTSDGRQGLSNDLGLTFTPSGDSVALDGVVYRSGDSIELKPAQIKKLSFISDLFTSATPEKTFVPSGNTASERYQSILDHRKHISPLQHRIPPSHESVVLTSIHGADGWLPDVKF